MKKDNSGKGKMPALLLAITGKAKKNEKADEVEETEEADLSTLSMDLLEAIKSEDSEAMALILRDIIRTCGE